MYTFPNFEQVHCSMSSSNCRFLSFIQVSQVTGNMFWYSHLLKNFSIICCDPHSQRLWRSEWSRSRCLLVFPCFFYDPLDVAIWCLAPQPFLNPACTSRSSQFRYCGCLTWWILSITLLACEMSTIIQCSLNILWHCPSLGLKWKVTFSSPVVTAEFFKFTDI